MTILLMRPDGMMTMIIVANHLWWPFQIWSKPLPHICIWLAQRAQIDWNVFSIEMEIRTGSACAWKLHGKPTSYNIHEKKKNNNDDRGETESKKKEKKNRNERQNGCVVHVLFERHVLLTHAINVQQQFVVYLFHFNELTFNKYIGLTQFSHQNHLAERVGRRSYKIDNHN